MVRFHGPRLPPPSNAGPSPSSYGRTDRERGWTRLADVPVTWGSGDNPRVCWLCGKAPPCILPARLMVSLPVHMSCFDLNIVYTNMSDVTHGGCQWVMTGGRRVPLEDTAGLPGCRASAACWRNLSTQSGGSQSEQCNRPVSAGEKQMARTMDRTLFIEFHCS